MAGLSSPRSCGHVQGGSCPSPPPLALKASLKGSQLLGGPQTLPHTLPQVSSAGNTARAGLGGKWLGQFLPAASLFSRLPLFPQGVRAGLGRAGGSRSQHSKGGLGGQARGKGQSINPFVSILSVPAESCRCSPSFETHTGHTHSKHAHVSAHALSP